MPVDPAEPVVTAACVFCCRRAMGEVITRHSLRPLRFSRATYWQHPGVNASRDRGDVFTSRWHEDSRARPGLNWWAWQLSSRSVQIAVRPWPLSQSWPSAAGRGSPAGHDQYPGAVDVCRFRCCAKAPVRASHATSIRRKTGPEPDEIEVSRPGTLEHP